MQSYQSMQSQKRSKAHIKLSTILKNSFIMCKIFFRGAYWHYGGQVFCQWDGDPWDWMGETERGAELAPPIPSQPWGVSGHLLLQLDRWDPVLKSRHNFTLNHQQWYKLKCSNSSTWHSNLVVVVVVSFWRHTFLGAACVCAVGLRLPELKEKYEKEQRRIKIEEMLFVICKYIKGVQVLRDS